MRPFGALAGKADALAALAARSRPVAGTERVPVEAAAGRVLAADLVAPADVPAFDRSAMDGYALRAADARAPGARLRVVGRAHAGEPWRGGALPPGAALEIATGAVLPPDLDAVVPFERTRREDETVVLAEVARPGGHVSARGGDLAAGEAALAAGDVLTPARVALAATLGLVEVEVRRRPRVAVVPSGTEVVAPGTPLPEGGVYDGNAAGLAALARRHGADVVRRAPVPDREDVYAEALREAAAAADLVVTTGGSSVGARDLLRAAVEAAGRVDVHGVRIRPGKPVLVGEAHGTPVLGLPGYPASALVTAEVFLVPAVRALAGLPPHAPSTRRGTLADEARKPEDFTLVLPVRLGEDGVARSTYKESGTLTSVTRSWGYVEVAEGPAAVGAGASVEVRAWS